MNGLYNTFLKRRTNAVQRTISAYSVVPALTSASIEAGSPIHVSFGSAAPGHDSTPLSLATADFAYYTAQRITVGDATPLLTVTEPSALPLAFDTLRRAYESRGPDAIAHYNEMRRKRVPVRWYPSGPQSLAFAGGISAMQTEEKISTHFLLGRLGVELALMIDAAQRQNSTVIASSDQLTGQAVAYAMADHALIGDEQFAAGAYLGQNPDILNRNRVMDMLRIVVAVTLIIATVAAVMQPGGA